MTVYALGEHHPRLPAVGTYWIAPTAAVIGRVHLAPDTSVWFGAVLRGDMDEISVGEGTNIQDGCVLHTDAGAPLTIGRSCTIGHAATLHGCTVGDNSLVGIRATVLDHAVIGRNCIIAAHALVLQGTIIPDNSLVVGVPGKVVRELPAENDAKTEGVGRTVQRKLEALPIRAGQSSASSGCVTAAIAILKGVNLQEYN